MSTRGDNSAMEWSRRTTGCVPVIILDVDRGLDFTFDGLRLIGNRPNTVIAEKDLIIFLRNSNYIEKEIREFALEDSRAAWDFLIRKNSLTLEDILEAHRILMQRVAPEIAGVLRTRGVRIGGGYGLRHEEVPDALNDWITRCKSLSSADDIKRAHIEFERIHGFQDGNGRIGRILLNWQRVKLGLPILIIFAVEKEIYYLWFKQK